MITAAEVNTKWGLCSLCDSSYNDFKKRNLTPLQDEASKTEHSIFSCKNDSHMKKNNNVRVSKLRLKNFPLLLKTTISREKDRRKKNKIL